MREFKNKSEREISLKDLMIYCLKKWRWIVVCMAMIAFLAGAFKYVSAEKSNQSKLSNMESVEGEEESILNPTVLYYQRIITEYENELERQGKYLEDSVVMHLDPNRVQTGTLAFYLKAEENVEILDAITEAYRIYITGGGLAQELSKYVENVDVSDLQYLLTVGDEDGNEHIQISEQNTLGHRVIQIQIAAPDEESCKNYMEMAESAMMKYSAELQTDLSEHELVLVSSSQSVQINTELHTYQFKILENYTSAAKNLQSMKTAMQNVIDEEGEVVKTDNSVTLDNPIIEGIKYAIAGGILGAFLACFILILGYIMSNKLQCINSFETEFDMCLLGEVRPVANNKKWFGFLDNWIYRMEDGLNARFSFEEQMRIVSSNLKAAILKDQSLKKIMLAGTISQEMALDICTLLKERIENISFSSYKQIVFCVSDLEELGEYDGVVFIEKKGESIAKLILREKELADDRNVNVLGAIVM